MATSYFKKATLINTNLEKLLYLQYQDMKQSKQVELEEKVIYILERHTIPKIEQMGIDVENTTINVRMIKNGIGTAIWLFNDNFKCVVLGKFIDEFCTKIKIDCYSNEEIKKKKNNKEKENRSVLEKAKWVEI